MLTGNKANQITQEIVAKKDLRIFIICPRPKLNKPTATTAADQRRYRTSCLLGGVPYPRIDKSSMDVIWLGKQTYEDGEEEGYPN